MAADATGGAPASVHLCLGRHASKARAHDRPHQDRGRQRSRRRPMAMVRRQPNGHGAVPEPLGAAERLGSSERNHDAGVAVRAGQIRPLAPRADAEGVPPEHSADRPRAVGSTRTLRAVTRGGWPPNSQGIAEFYDGGLAHAVTRAGWVASQLSGDRRVLRPCARARAVAAGPANGERIVLRPRGAKSGGEREWSRWRRTEGETERERHCSSSVCLVGSAPVSRGVLRSFIFGRHERRTGRGAPNVERRVLRSSLGAANVERRVLR